MNATADNHSPTGAALLRHNNSPLEGECANRNAIGGCGVGYGAAIDAEGEFANGATVVDGALRQPRALGGGGATTARSLSVSCVAKALDQAKLLEEVSDTPQLDCQLLLAHTLGRTRAWLLAHEEAALGEADASRFAALLEQRRRGVPIAYLLGEREFWARRFKVNQDCLVPRPETELLVATALQRLDARPRLVGDLGTGSGAVAASLAAERPGWTLVATDLSAEALELARQNGAGLGNLLLVRGDWLDAFRPGSFDLIVCNPPYLAADDPALPSLAYEPRAALAADQGGLGDLQRVAYQACSALKPGGLLLLEHGYQQGPAMRQLLGSLGYVQVEQLQDLAGHERALAAVWAPPPPNARHLAHSPSAGGVVWSSLRSRASSAHATRWGARPRRLWLRHRPLPPPLALPMARSPSAGE